MKLKLGEIEYTSMDFHFNSRIIDFPNAQSFSIARAHCLHGNDFLCTFRILLSFYEKLTSHKAH